MLVEFILNNAFLAVITALLGVATIVLWSMPADAAVIDPYNAVRIINDSKAQPVDLRSKADYDKGHIPRARQIGTDELIARGKELSGKGPLLLVCANGQTAAGQLPKLREAGIEAFALRGGLVAWKEAGQPLKAAKTAKKR
ncbi:MAG: rhodanese-like domain-containing protein [Betaproteobacteria bacterium]|nr:rhodanese-like domain-containing protein [Betaproteobacteria bacterium]